MKKDASGGNLNSVLDGLKSKTAHYSTQSESHKSNPLYSLESSDENEKKPVGHLDSLLESLKSRPLYSFETTKQIKRRDIDMRKKPIQRKSSLSAVGETAMQMLQKL